MITSLITCGVSTNQTWPYYITVGLIANHISNQVKLLDIDLK